MTGITTAEAGIEADERQFDHARNQLGPQRRHH